MKLRKPYVEHRRFREELRRDSGLASFSARYRTLGLGVLSPSGGSPDPSRRYTVDTTKP